MKENSLPVHNFCYFALQMLPEPIRSPLPLYKL